MLYFFIKVLISAVLIAAISEIARRHSGFVEHIATLLSQIFWLVLSSLLLFLPLPALLKAGLGFWPSLSLSAIATIGCYFAALHLLRRVGIKL